METKRMQVEDAQLIKYLSAAWVNNRVKGDPLVVELDLRQEDGRPFFALLTRLQALALIGRVAAALEGMTTTVAASLHWKKEEREFLMQQDWETALQMEQDNRRRD